MSFIPQTFVMKGDIAYTPTPECFATVPNGWLVCERGRSAGVYVSLPEKYAALPVVDCTGRLIVPGLCDAHLHAPQFAFRGLGMDLELLDWLNERAFPEEARYADETYAARAYALFAEALRKSATTRAAVFATSHVKSTLLLMEQLERTGTRAYVGKVNMDRNAPEALLDGPTEETVRRTGEWIEEADTRFRHVRPILTPRFAPSCGDALLSALGRLREKHNLPVQTHLSENPSEVALVRELFPGLGSYAEVYARFGLMGRGFPSVMAHCVYPEESDFSLLRTCGAMAAHCPASNADLASGIAPVRQWLDSGVAVALGTDIAGGFDLSIFRAMADAVQASKLYARSREMRVKPLRLSEAFYMGTKGAGALFGQVGSFEPDYAFDALALDDSALASPRTLSVAERVARAVYLDREVVIERKYADGDQII